MNTMRCNSEHLRAIKSGRQSCAPYARLIPVFSVPTSTVLCRRCHCPRGQPGGDEHAGGPVPQHDRPAAAHVLSAGWHVPRGRVGLQAGPIRQRDHSRVLIPPRRRGIALHSPHRPDEAQRKGSNSSDWRLFGVNISLAAVMQRSTRQSAQLQQQQSVVLSDNCLISTSAVPQLMQRSTRQSAQLMQQQHH